MASSESPQSVATASAGQRRNFFRVSARIPVRVRPLEAAEAAAVALEINAPAEDLLAVADSAVSAALQRLERKLDLLIARLDPDRPRPLGQGDMRNVLLSASGLAVAWEADEEPGEQVLVELQLPGAPGRDVRAIAHPVSGPAQRGDKDGLLAMAFDVLTEADREAIVRFSHDVQRFELRERSIERHGT